MIGYDSFVVKNMAERSQNDNIPASSKNEKDQKKKSCTSS